MLPTSDSRAAFVLVVGLLLASTRDGRADGGNNSVAIQGPTAPLIFDVGTRSISRMVGTSGSGYLAPPLFNEVEAFASTRTGLHLLIRKGRVFVVEASVTPSPAEIEVEGIPGGVVGVAWNAEGTAAVAWSGETAYVLQPRSSTDVELVSTTSLSQPGEQIHAAALVNRSALLISAGGTESGAIYFVDDHRNAGQPRLVMRTASPTHLSAGAARVYAVDVAAQQILQISASGAISSSLETGHGLDHPVASAVTSEGDSLYVLNDRGRVLQVYDVADGRLTSQVALEFVGCGIGGVTGSSKFLVQTCSQAAPLLVVDPGQGLEIRFVPRSRQD